MMGDMFTELEDTDSRVIVLDESGEQLVPQNYILVYVKPNGELEGLWKHGKDSSVLQYLFLHQRLLSGAADTLAQLLEDTLGDKLL